MAENMTEEEIAIQRRIDNPQTYEDYFLQLRYNVVLIDQGIPYPLQVITSSIPDRRDFPSRTRSRREAILPPKTINPYRLLNVGESVRIPQRARTSLPQYQNLYKLRFVSAPDPTAEDFNRQMSIQGASDKRIFRVWRIPEFAKLLKGAPKRHLIPGKLQGEQPQNEPEHGYEGDANADAEVAKALDPALVEQVSKHVLGMCPGVYYLAIGESLHNFPTRYVSQMPVLEIFLKKEFKVTPNSTTPKMCSVTRIA